VVRAGLGRGACKGFGVFVVRRLKVDVEMEGGFEVVGVGLEEETVGVLAALSSSSDSSAEIEMESRVFLFRSVDFAVKISDLEEDDTVGLLGACNSSNSSSGMTVDSLLSRPSFEGAVFGVIFVC